MKKRILTLAAAAVLGAAPGAYGAVAASVTSLGTPTQGATTMTGFTAYRLTLLSNDRAVTGVDLATGIWGISGPLHQRTAITPADPDLGTPETRSSTPLSTATTGGDSHLLFAPADLLSTPDAPSEDNSGNGSPLADTGTSDWGQGSFLEASFALAPARQSTALDLAYLVIPNGQIVTVTGQASDSVGSTLPFAVAVPEPAALGLLGLAATGLLGRRRRA